MDVAELISLGSQIIQAADSDQLCAEIALVSLESIHRLVKEPAYGARPIGPPPPYTYAAPMPYAPFPTAAFAPPPGYEPPPPPFAVDDAMLPMPMPPPMPPEYARAPNAYGFTPQY